MNFALGARAARVNRTPGSRYLEHNVTSAGRCLLVSGTAGPWSLPFLFEESAALGGGGEGAGIVLRCWHRLRFWLRGAFCVILKKLKRERQAWMIQGLNSVSYWCRPSLRWMSTSWLAEYLKPSCISVIQADPGLLSPGPTGRTGGLSMPSEPGLGRRLTVHKSLRDREGLTVSFLDVVMPEGCLSIVNRNWHGKQNKNETCVTWNPVTLDFSLMEMILTEFPLYGKPWTFKWCPLILTVTEGKNCQGAWSEISECKCPPCSGSKERDSFPLTIRGKFASCCLHRKLLSFVNQ